MDAENSSSPYYNLVDLPQACTAPPQTSPAPPQTSPAPPQHLGTNTVSSQAQPDSRGTVKVIMATKLSPAFVGFASTLCTSPALILLKHNVKQVYIQSHIPRVAHHFSIMSLPHAHGCTGVCQQSMQHQQSAVNHVALSSCRS